MFSLLSAPAFGANVINIDENGHGPLNNGAFVPASVFSEPISGQLAPLPCRRGFRQRILKT
jgi:hypothetical protein